VKERNTIFSLCFCHPEERRTQYLHKLLFYGKEDLQSGIKGIKDIKNIPVKRKELVVLFDSGSPVDIIDTEVGKDLFHEFVTVAPPHIVGGRVTEPHLLFVGNVEINGKFFDCTFQGTQLKDWIIDDLPLDVLIGLPTMRKWGIVFDSTNGGIALKVIEPIYIPSCIA
jgi:hypothetical protein